MDAKELKPCPMCGAAPKLIVGFSPLDHAFVDCECGMQTELKDKADEVVAMWNRRAALPSDAAQAPLTDEQRTAVEKAAFMLKIFAGHDSGANLLHHFGKGWREHAKKHTETLRAMLAAAPVAPQSAGEAAQAPICWITKEQLGQIEDLSADAWVYWRETGHVAESDEVPLYAAPAIPQAAGDAGQAAVAVALTTEQRESLEHAIHNFDRKRFIEDAKNLRALLAAPVPPAAAAPSEHEKMMLDAVIHGQGFMKDGKHVPLNQVRAQPDERAAFEQAIFDHAKACHESTSATSMNEARERLRALYARATAPQTTGPIYQIGANAGGGIAWWDVDQDRYEREKKAGYMKTCVVYREK